jgi:hypothetical protein
MPTVSSTYLLFDMPNYCCLIHTTSRDYLLFGISNDGMAWVYDKGMTDITC